MPLTRLSLTDFRSYPDLLVEPGPGLVILTGENGAGKTNVLEAVSLLAPGRGLRGAALAEMGRTGGPGGFAVAARLTSPLQQGLEGSHIDLGTGALASAPERRQVRINGAPAAANSLGEWLSVLWLTPAMDRLFIEAASGRRRFLDRLTLALQPAHAMHAARYEAAMRARNKLLAEEGVPDPDWLTALEARMAEHGHLLASARASAVRDLAGQIAAEPDSVFARADLALAGWLPARDDCDALARDLKRDRARDAAAGRTLAGPHRTDLAVTHAAKAQPAARSSTGEQKALLLGLVLAHAELVRRRTGRPLILLLDEVAAHLDPSRRAALFERLSLTGSQVWMTGTEPSLFEGAGPGACWYRVAGGTAQPA
ncbi:MAG TPA: DNA replication/repair protein RecF [Allosphingosinicella sp.]